MTIGSSGLDAVRFGKGGLLFEILKLKVENYKLKIQSGYS